MELIKEIKDAEKFEEAKVRDASRAIIFKGSTIPLLFVSQRNYHKLPGGGVEPDENIIEALKREVLEEVGCEIEVTKEVGTIVEYRSRWGLKQTSHCYIAKVVGDCGKTAFTKKETDQGFQLKWVSFGDALALLRSDKPSSYEGEFIQKRDTTFLEKANELYQLL